ncbi:MAG: redox-regulated ATPase YchF [Candidatus Harrisonbacteria bacterium]|nr:redox-regulated ATPase YchF [Candidatus Harrisonbacteria bacterium]
MKLSMGIVGLPNVGKSTLFKAITKNEVLIANYPFATIDPNIGIVTVPDERLDKLNEMSKSAKKIPAIVEFYDIAGLVKGANAGEGLGNQFLNHIRETNAIVEVLRCFPSDEIIHIENTVDPIRDMEIINTELALKDLDTVEKNFKKIDGEARSAGSTSSPQAKKDLEMLQKAKTALEQGKMLFTKEFSGVLENEKIRTLNLLTAKPQIYLLNGDPDDVSGELKKKIKDLGADYVIVNLGKDLNLSDLIKKSYEILNLISFFTTGEDETRAWTIERGTKAPQAAGVIHTDFENKFIRAEAVNWQKFLEADGWAKAKQRGWLRLEGKDYVVADGDVIEIRHG